MQHLQAAEQRQHVAYCTITLLCVDCLPLDRRASAVAAPRLIGCECFRSLGLAPAGAGWRPRLCPVAAPRLIRPRYAAIGRT